MLKIIAAFSVAFGVACLVKLVGSYINYDTDFPAGWWACLTYLFIMDRNF